MPLGIVVCPGIISLHLFQPEIEEMRLYGKYIRHIPIHLNPIILPFGGRTEKFVYLDLLGVN